MVCTIPALLMLLGMASAWAQNPASVFGSTNFVLQQNQSVQTVTCATFFVHTDASQYGNVSGQACRVTGPILPGDGNTGNVTIAFDFPKQHVTIHGCRLDDVAAWNGNAQFSVNCDVL